MTTQEPVPRVFRRVRRGTLGLDPHMARIGKGKKQDKTRQKVEDRLFRMKLESMKNAENERQDRGKITTKMKIKTKAKTKIQDQDQDQDQILDQDQTRTKKTKQTKTRTKTKTKTTDAAKR